MVGPSCTMIRLCPALAVIALALMPSVASQRRLYQGANMTDAERNIYCDTSRPFYCENHIACISNMSMGCTSTRFIEPTLANAIQHIHNDCRQRVTRKEPDAPPSRDESHPRLGKLPPSAGFMKMQWDVELAALASLWTVACATVQEAKSNKDFMYYDFPSTHSHKTMKMKFTGLQEPVRRFKFCFDISRFRVAGWLWIQREQERRNPYDTWRKLLWRFCANVSRTLPQLIIESYRSPLYSLGSDYPEPGVCMLWASSSRVGCGQRLRSVDDSSVFQYETFACLYGPAPLVYGERVYEVGMPGEGCPPQAPAAASVWPLVCIVSFELSFAIVVAVLVGMALTCLSVYVAHTS